MIKKLLFLSAFLLYNAGFSQNNYLDFDGIDDNVTVTSSENVLANATAITLSCKVYPKSTTTGFPNFDGFAGYRNENNFDFYLIQLTATEVEARFRNASGVAFTITYNGLVLNQWNHFFLVYNGSTLKLYSGTNEVGSIAANGSAPASNILPLKIGLVQYQSFNWYHNGYIDEVSLWNKALTPIEIGTILSNSGNIANPVSETNLKLYYKFNQGIPYGNNTGLTSLTDEKVTANGTLNNFTLNGNSSNWGSQTLGSTNFNKEKAYVYPNPSSSVLNFSNFTDISTVKVVDLSGRIVLTKKVNSIDDTSINISELNSGVYFATINDSQNIKFIKN